jgi:hypothetical protein
MSELPTAVRLVLWCFVTAGSSAAAQQSASPGSTTVRTEQELKLSIEVPALPSRQCEAAIATSYHQRNAVARVLSKINTGDCAAAGGEFKVALRVRDDSGEVKTLEFPGTWQRSDAAELELTSDYPIGDNAELVSARVRGLTCTCAEPAGAAEAAAAGASSAPVTETR